MMFMYVGFLFMLIILGGGANVSSFSREGLVVPEYQVTLFCSDSAPQLPYLVDH